MRRAIVGSLIVLLAGVTVLGDDPVTLPCGLIDEDNHGYDNLDVIVDGCVVTIDGTHPFNSVRVINGGVITHSAGKSNLHLIIATDLIVDPNSWIWADGRGYPSATGPGRGANCYSTHGSIGGGGAGYGGNGGNGTCSGSEGSAYGSLMTPNEPNDLGSGGGTGGTSNGTTSGGKGGGCLRLTVGGVFTLDGSLTANGTNGGRGDYSSDHWAGGGGSGGSIYVAAGTIAGTGRMLANGGNAGNTSSGGGGAGGRIRIEYGTLDPNIVLIACGGDGKQDGGAGTIVLKSDEQDYGTLVVDNWERDNEQNTWLVDDESVFDEAIIRNLAHLVVDTGKLLKLTSGTLSLAENGKLYVWGGVVEHVHVSEGAGRFDVIDVNDALLWVNPGGRIGSHILSVSSGGEIYLIEGGQLDCGQVEILSGGTFYLDGAGTFSGMHIASGGVLTHTAGNTDFDLVTTGDLTVDIGGFIYANGLGHPSVAGPGKGGNCYSTHGSIGGGGAGYGGKGGDGTCSGSGGSKYGFLLEPVDLGSGGGTGGTSNGTASGGRGGGCLRLTVDGVFTLDGITSANATSGVKGDYSSDHWAGGGGSGGSIYVAAGTIAGAGTMSANGGAGGNTSIAGGGAGGRIAIYYLDVNGFDLFGGVSVEGGAGREAGQDGSVFLWGPNRGPFVGNDSGTDCTGGYMDHYDVVFTRPIDVNTFTVDDINLVGPCGVMEVNEPNLISAIAGFETYRLSFAHQTQVGRYDLSVGPDITGTNGKLMDQNVNNIGGIDPDDIYKRTFGFCKGLPDACEHAITQDDIDQWVSLGEPPCWLDSCHCRGDANGDCILNSVDVLALRKAWPGLGGTYNPCVDSSYDGVINSVDVLALRTYWPGLGGLGCSGIPCCE